MLSNLKVAAAAALISMASVAGAADLAAGLKKCAADTDSLRRLTCYDALASGAGASPATASPAKEDAKQGSQQCQGITKKGAQCSRKAQPGRSYCYQHGT